MPIDKGGQYQSTGCYVFIVISHMYLSWILLGYHLGQGTMYCTLINQNDAIFLYFFVLWQGEIYKILKCLEDH